jgi:stearoyl-CoA desaturase (delta-9 desaturase)
MLRIPLLFWLALAGVTGFIWARYMPSGGLYSLSWVECFVLTMVLSQITILTVTIYLHRTVAHGSLELSRPLAGFFRFWCWFMSGMERREWGKLHRAHHAHVETEFDPHSPVQKGLLRILVWGADYYKISARGLSDARYISDIPPDWFDRNVAEKYSFLGITISASLLILLFGPLGLITWAVCMAWIPIFAAGVINGIGHAWGYRNFATKNHKGDFEDASTNISPIGFFIGGEELHNNHHAFPTSAKFSVRRWEFDIGWFWINIFRFFRLLKVKRVVRPVFGYTPNPVYDKKGYPYECVKKEA